MISSGDQEADYVILPHVTYKTLYRHDPSIDFMLDIDTSFNIDSIIDDLPVTNFNYDQCIDNLCKFCKIAQNIGVFCFEDPICNMPSVAHYIIDNFVHIDNVIYRTVQSDRVAKKFGVLRLYYKLDDNLLSRVHTELTFVFGEKNIEWNDSIIKIILN